MQIKGQNKNVNIWTKKDYFDGKTLKMAPGTKIVVIIVIKTVFVFLLSSAKSINLYIFKA